MFAKMRSIRTWSLNRLKILFTFRAFKIFFYKKPQSWGFILKKIISIYSTTMTKYLETLQNLSASITISLATLPSSPSNL